MFQFSIAFIKPEHFSVCASNIYTEHREISIPSSLHKNRVKRTHGTHLTNLSENKMMVCIQK